jgi:2-amino-4-hydroxy-6-hydroxymethyldihydropteridine diphosphokinase
VLVPWLAVDPQAQLTVAAVATPVARLLEDIEPIDKAGVMPTDLTLRSTV